MVSLDILANEAVKHYAYIGTLVLDIGLEEDFDFESNWNGDDLWNGVILFTLNRIYKDDKHELPNLYSDIERLLEDCPDEASLTIIVRQFTPIWHFEEIYGSNVNFINKIKDEVKRQIELTPI